MSQIGITLADGFDRAQFCAIRQRLGAAEHQVIVIGPCDADSVASECGGLCATVDAVPPRLLITDLDALLIPGGQTPSHLRQDKEMVELVHDFVSTGQPIAAIGSGAQLLIEAGAVSGRMLTSWPAMRSDVVNAGAAWIDATLVLDGNLLTCRQPHDVGLLCDKLIEVLVRNSHT